MRGSSAAQFIHSKRGVAISIHGFRPGIFRIAVAPGSTIPVFFRVGAAVEKDLQRSVSLRRTTMFRMSRRSAIYCCQFIGAAPGLVRGSGQKIRQACVEGVDAVLGAECARSRRRNDFVHRRRLHGESQVFAVETTAIVACVFGQSSGGYCGDVSPE